MATGAGATGAAKVVRGDGRLAVAGPGKKDEVKKKVEKGRRDGTRGRRRQGGGGRRCVGAAIVAWAAVWARFAFDVAEHDLAWWHKRAVTEARWTQRRLVWGEAFVAFLAPPRPVSRTVVAGWLTFQPPRPSVVFGVVAGNQAGGGVSPLALLPALSGFGGGGEPDDGLGSSEE